MSLHNRMYRERLRQSGKREVLIALPEDVIAVLDQLRAETGLRGRGAVAATLIAQAVEEHYALKSA